MDVFHKELVTITLIIHLTLVVLQEQIMLVDYLDIFINAKM